MVGVGYGGDCVYCDPYASSLFNLYTSYLSLAIFFLIFLLQVVKTWAGEYVCGSGGPGTPALDLSPDKLCGGNGKSVIVLNTNLINTKMNNVNNTNVNV